MPLRKHFNKTIVGISAPKSNLAKNFIKKFKIKEIYKINLTI